MEGSSQERHMRRNVQTFIIIWDTVAFHHAPALTDCFEDGPRMISLFLLQLTPLLNPIKSFSSWRCGRYIYDHCSHRCPFWMQWMLHARTYCICGKLPGMDQAFKEVCSHVYGKREYKVYYIYELVAQSRGPGWLALIYIFINEYKFYVYSMCVFFLICNCCFILCFHFVLAFWN